MHTHTRARCTVSLRATGDERTKDILVKVWNSQKKGRTRKKRENSPPRVDVDQQHTDVDNASARNDQCTDASMSIYIYMVHRM